MPDSPLATAHRHLGAAIEELSAVADGATDSELMSMLTLCEGLTRQLDQLTVSAVAALERRGTFAERGYRSTAAALGDLLGWERFESRRHVTAAEQVCPRVGLDGAALPARLPATAEVFAAGAASLRHVEAIARVLSGPSAERLTPETWANAEAQLAAKAQEYTPSELQSWGDALIELLDQDGAAPDDRPAPQVNELHLTRHRSGSGGRLKARFDDAAMFDAIAAVIDAHAKPAPPTTTAPPPNARPKPSPTPAATSSTTATCLTAAADAHTSTCSSGSTTSRTAPAPPCSTSGESSLRHRCACWPATPGSCRS